MRGGSVWSNLPRRAGLVVAAASSALIWGGSVLAAPVPTVTITSPTEGAEINRAAGSFTVAGTAGFTTPTPDTTKLYLRWETGCDAPRFLSLTDGTDAGNFCQSPTATITTLTTPLSNDWPADPVKAGLPITIDATRNLTGEVFIRTHTFTVPSGVGNWVQMDVSLSLNGTTITESFDSGVYTTPGYTFQLDMDIPDALDRVDASTVKLEIVWKRLIHVPGPYHTYLSLDNPASFIAIPSYTGSFDRRVQVSIDDAGFGPDAVPASVDLDAGTYTADVLTEPLTLGPHAVYARALQGGVPSGTHAVQVNVLAGDAS